MKRNLYLLCAAACLFSCAACGRRHETGTHVPEATAVVTERSTRRTEHRTTTLWAGDMRDMADNAAEGVSEMAGDAAGLVTDAAADSREAAEKRRGDGGYSADDDGRVAESTN